MLGQTAAGTAQYAKGMGFIHHEEGPVSQLYFPQGWQIRQVAIHAVQALHHDERALMAGAEVGQQTVQLL